MKFALFLILSIFIWLIPGVLFASTAANFTDNTVSAQFSPNDIKKLIFDLTLPTPQSDTALDCDGGTTTGVGTCATASGSTLTLVASGTTAGTNTDGLCANSTSSPTIIFLDSDDDCNASTGTITSLIGTAASTSPKVLTNWRYKDSNANSIYNAGENLYLDNDASTFLDGDQISAFAGVTNVGSAVDLDVDAIRIYQENGSTSGFQSTEDISLGSITNQPFFGRSISVSGAQAWTATAKNRFYVVVDLSAGARVNVTFQAKAAVNAFTFTSTNSGPTDAAKTSGAIQTVTGGVSARIDKIAPTSTINFPLDQAVLSSFPVIITGTAIDSGGSAVKSTSVFINGVAAIPEATGNNFSTWRYIWYKPQDGIYTINVRAIDYFNNTESPGPAITVSVSSSQAVAGGQPTSVSQISPGFQRNLGFGNTGDDVKNLQEILKAKGFFPAKQESTGFFGLITKEAVKKFQKSRGLPTFGFFGPLTRAEIGK